MYARNLPLPFVVYSVIVNKMPYKLTSRVWCRWFCNLQALSITVLQVVLLGLHAHLNSLFAHLIEFNIHYNTIEDKETEVLQVGLPPVFSLIFEYKLVFPKLRAVMLFYLIFFRFFYARLYWRRYGNHQHFVKFWSNIAIVFSVFLFSGLFRENSSMNILY